MNNNPSFTSRHHPGDVVSKHSFIAERHQDFLVLDRLQSLFSQNPYFLGQVTSLQIDSSGVIATITNPSFRYYVNTLDSRDCAIESLNFGGFEPLDGFLIFNSCSFLSSNSSPLIALDVGANAGWYSLAIASLFHSSSIHCFEPVPDTYKRLCNNIHLNSFTDRILPNNLAIHEFTGSTDFYFSPSLSGNSSFSNNLQPTPDQISLSVNTLPLDDYIFSNNLRPHFLKIDVEGAELFAIKSALQALSKFTPFVFIELSRKWSSEFGYNPNEVIDILSSLDYKCLCLQDDNSLLNITSISDSLPFTNFLFVPSTFYESFVSNFRFDLSLL